MRPPRLALSLLAALAGISLLAGAGVAAVTTQAATAAPFVNYQAPEGLGDRAGEPTLGVNPKTGAILYQAYTETLRVTGLKADGSATWEKGTFPVPQPRSFDPILRTDAETGRTFTSQLLLACSQGGFTDDDAKTFTLSTGCGPASAFDHQTVGFGPYVKDSPLTPLKNPATNYPNVVYYCAQDVATAKCSMSTDGGITFPTTGVVYTTVECQLGGIFGHIKSAPDGTVYLPPRYCPDLNAGEYQTGVAVSEDNGITWDVREIPGSVYGDAGHPSVGVGRNGDIYMGYGGPKDGKTVFQSGPAMASMSTDKGVTFTPPVALGQELGIQNSRFPVAVAGDAGKAAIGYLGSKTAGDGSAPDFAGRWDLYVSFTEDSGKTWQTLLATPEHPVQVGPICTSGTTCGASRNLLDFNDMQIEPATGRVLVAYADGCPGTAECTTESRFQKASIARQVGGPQLVQPATAVPPAAPAPAAPPESGSGEGTSAPQAEPATSGPVLAATGTSGALGVVGLLLLVVSVVLLRRSVRAG